MVNLTKKKDSTLSLWGCLVIIYSISLYTIKNDYNQYVIIQFSVISSLIFTLLEAREIKKHTETYFTPGFIYLALYYIFQNGMLLLFAFSSDSNMNYIKKFEDQILNASVYSSISNVIAGYAYLYIVEKTRSIHKQKKIDKYSKQTIFKIGYTGFILTGIVAVPLVLLKFSVARSGGYHAVRSFEESIPFIINFIEYLFVPFAVLCLVYSTNKKRNIVFYTTLIWLLLTAFCGDRTVGLSGILILFFINLKCSPNQEKNKKGIFKFILILIGLMIMVQVISIGRQSGDYSSLNSDEGFLMHFISELGFSCVNLFSMMGVVPQSEGYLYGSGYIASFISGFIPANADPTGLIRTIMQYRDIANVWIDQYYDFSFGIGFSLNSESYINFGWFGLIMIFFINYIVFYFLNYSNPQRNPSTFDIYISFVLLFLWCTLPRRDSYYIWKAIVYSIIFIKLYLFLFLPKDNQNRGINIKSKNYNSHYISN